MLWSRAALLRVLVALQVAEQTTEIACVTLGEIQRQGQKLDRAELGMEAVSAGCGTLSPLPAARAELSLTALSSPSPFLQMEKDVQEASRIVRFMRRWCFFQVLCCCDCFDPDVESDRTRKRRLDE